MLLLFPFLRSLALSNVNSATFLRPPCQEGLDPLRVSDKINLGPFSCYFVTVTTTVTDKFTVLGQMADDCNLHTPEAGDHEFKPSFDFLVRPCLKIQITKLLIFMRVN